MKQPISRLRWLAMGLLIVLMAEAAAAAWLLTIPNVTPWIRDRFVFVVCGFLAASLMLMELPGERALKWIVPLLLSLASAGVVICL